MLKDVGSPCGTASAETLSSNETVSDASFNVVAIVFIKSASTSSGGEDGRAPCK